MDVQLCEAAIRGDVQILHDRLNEDATMRPVQPLLDRVMHECTGKDNPLHLGALFGHVDFVREISTQKPEFARQLNSQGKSPLHLAAERGHVEVVNELLRIDDGVCFVQDRDGRIPLHLAVIKGRVEVVEQLVNARNITAWFLTNEKEPILHLCSNHDQPEVLKKLVRLVNDDAFLRLKDSNDNTILHIVSANVQKEMAAFLLDNTNIELEINALNVERRTALDELSRVQFDLGYFGLRAKLRTKGAIRASALRRIPYQRKGTSLYRKRLQRMEAPLLVFAILVANVTYQSIFNPPGGVWKDDYPPPSPVKGRDDTRQHHKAGKPIFLSGKPLRYHMFILFNNVGFFASWATIVGIVTGKRLLLVQVLMSEAIASVSWVVAYLLAVSSISPVSLYYSIGVLIFFILWAFYVAPT